MDEEKEYPLCQRQSRLLNGYIVVGTELKHALIFPLGFAPNLAFQCRRKKMAFVPLQG